MRFLKLSFGWLQAQWLQLNHVTKAAVLQEVFERSVCSSTIKQKEFVLYVGFSKSGKSTHRRSSTFRDFAGVETTTIHQVINSAFGLLNDDRSVDGPGYWARQWLTRSIRQKVLHRLCSLGYAVVEDSCNLNLRERGERLAVARQYGYHTTLIYVSCFEPVLLERLGQFDRENLKRGLAPTWVDLYLTIQRFRFEAPQFKEADTIVHVNSNSIPQRQE